MVDRDRVDQLFAMLARYVRILRDLADIPLAEYQADPRNFGSGERFLQLAIETTLSVGHHIIASAGFDQPTTYAEVFRVLGKEGVLAAMRVAVRRSPAPSSTVGEAEAQLSACLMPVIFGSMTKPHRGGSA